MTAVKQLSACLGDAKWHGIQSPADPKAGSVPVVTNPIGALNRMPIGPPRLRPARSVRIGLKSDSEPVVGGT